MPCGPGAPVDRRWVANVFKSWHFTTKKIHWRSPNKYTLSNILHYAGFISWFPTIPFNRLKFGDEAHFVRGGNFCLFVCPFVVLKSLISLCLVPDLRRKKGVAPAGRIVEVVDNKENRKLAYSITLVGIFLFSFTVLMLVHAQVTDLTRPSGYYVSEPRQDSNSAEDFLFFFVELILVGVLVRGDFFIVDNSPVHFSEEIAAAIQAIEVASGVRLRFTVD